MGLRFEAEPHLNERGLTVDRPAIRLRKPLANWRTETPATAFRIVRVLSGGAGNLRSSQSVTANQYPGAQAYRSDGRRSPGHVSARR